MQRVKLIVSMMILSLVMVMTVYWCSPYEPVVKPYPAEIEEIWAIEDGREESDAPLVTELFFDDMPLVYEKETNTFFCPLGLEQGQEWPKLHLIAHEADSHIRIVFVDNYRYDACADAVREGYAYQIMAYDDHVYSYAQIVFTGMMQVHIKPQQEIVAGDDVPARIEIGSYGQSLASNGRVHKRGGVTADMDKCGYRIEFTKQEDGKKKIAREVPAIGETENLVLLSMALDDSMMRDRLNWEIYNELVSEDEPFGDRIVTYAELYIDGEYRGVYLMLEPYDYKTEIAKDSMKNVGTDSVYRSGSAREGKGRDVYQGPFLEGRGFELHYTSYPEDGSAHLADYIELCLTEDDAAFCARALLQVDVNSMLRYLLLTQGCGWADNIFNNMFLWARHAGGKVVYHFAPWDMDRSFGERPERIGEAFDKWIYFPLADRMIRLNAGGIRGQMKTMWADLRARVLNMAFLERKTQQYARELNESGAARRNAERWQTEEYEANGYSLLDFASVRFELIDGVVDAIAGDPEADFPFLSGGNYQIDKSETIIFP